MQNWRYPIHNGTLKAFYAQAWIIYPYLYFWKLITSNCGFLQKLITYVCLLQKSTSYSSEINPFKSKNNTIFHIIYKSKFQGYWCDWRNTWNHAYSLFNMIRRCLQIFNKSRTWERDNVVNIDCDVFLHLTNYA